MSLRGLRLRLGQRLLHSPIHPWIARVARLRDPYPRWVAAEAGPPMVDFKRRPTISIVVPIFNPRREWLAAAIDSVFAQTYPDWELCLADDGSREPWVKEELAARAGDPRVRFVCAEHGGISAALNNAGRLATGEYAAFLDHDDVLSPYALQSIAAALQDDPADILYTDEDVLDEQGRRILPNFKPAWSPDLLLSGMYWGHLVTVRRAILEEIGWFRSGFDGSQDYDLALRLTDRPRTIRHVPRVLYHWRRHSGSVAGDAGGKRYTEKTGKLALEEAIARRGWAAQVEDGPRAHTYRLRWNLTGSVEIIRCSHATPISKDWEQRLAAQALRPDVGIAAARLIDPAGAIYDAGGVHHSDGSTSFPGRGQIASPYWQWLDLTRDVSKISGCVFAIRRELLAGFGRDLRIGELCEKVREAGLRIIHDASAVLVHRGEHSSERQFSACSGDPYFSPRLTMTEGRIELGDPAFNSSAR